MRQAKQRKRQWMQKLYQQTGGALGMPEDPEDLLEDLGIEDEARDPGCSGGGKRSSSPVGYRSSVEQGGPSFAPACRFSFWEATRLTSPPSAQGLLRWSEALDFESYQEEWQSLACTAASEASHWAAPRLAPASG